MQAHAEHEEDDPQLGELADRARVSDESGGERSDRHAGQQISDQGRKAQLAGEVATDEGGGERRRDVDQQREVVHVSPSFLQSSGVAGNDILPPGFFSYLFRPCKIDQI